jgi:hypothetical protein
LVFQQPVFRCVDIQKPVWVSMKHLCMLGKANTVGLRHSEIQSSNLLYDRRSVGQSASLSCNKPPIWGLQLDFYNCQRVCGFVDVGLSLTRKRACRLQLLLALASAVIFVSESLGTRDHILLS